MPEAPLTACDVEPIHSPGLIQPHGVLLVLHQAGGALRVIAASENAGGEHATHPAAYLDPEARQQLERAMALQPHGAGDLPLGLLRDARGALWDATLRPGACTGASGEALLELEPVGPAAAEPRGLLERLNRGLAAIQRQTGSSAACQAAVAAIGQVSGFDRVMAYRLLGDGSGEVVAEALHPDSVPADPALPASYLGLRFPASDIPAPARGLYNSAAVRLIPDARAQPSRLLNLAGGDAPVDLSRAVLRGVAPVHLTYLANMGVFASMSIAIRDGKGGLWGLFACHHLQGPLHVGPEIRLAAEILARALSWRLAELEAGLAERRTARLRAASGVLLAGIRLPDAAGRPQPPGPPPDADSPALLLAACEADGVAACPRIPGLEPVRIGAAPPDAILELLCAWLDEREAPGELGAPEPSLQTNALPGLLPPDLASALAADDAAPCGLLAIRLPGAGWLLLLRRELARVVTWAGNPEKPVDTGRRSAAGPDSGLPALSPRASFAAWSQAVRGQSAHWSEADRAVALALRDVLGEALLARAAGIARGNQELRRRSEETRFFADAAAHDLREPLWQIQVLSEAIGEGLEDLPADRPAAPATVADLRQLTQSVVRSAARMQDMVGELSRLAVAGHQADRSHPVPLRDVAGEALEDIRRGVSVSPELAHAVLAESRIDLDGLGAVSVRADRAQVRRVFQNLFSNAVKYRDPERPLQVVAEARPAVGGIVQVQVADNGVGFDPAHAPHLFEPFRRFPNRSAAATQGLGLGLAICQRIVSAHGGAIAAGVPPSGTGACFSFTLVEPDPGKLEEAAGAPDGTRTAGDPA
ncbi:ATP-binding protein [Lichenicoccus sp.]|uniref:ATP-binding protein n=1 Tax=Lichenicoccus sp. TaxID=2781899 RepID=UPI003D14AC1B